MARPSFIKTTVDGIPLREFLIRSLVTKTYRQLLKDEQFKEKTGINTIGNFYNQAKKLDIDMKAVYEYGIRKSLIPENETLEQWLARTRKHFSQKQIADERLQLETVGKQVGLYFDKSTSVDVIRITLIDFVGEQNLTRMINLIPKPRAAKH